MVYFLNKYLVDYMIKTLIFKNNKSTKFFTEKEIININRFCQGFYWVGAIIAIISKLLTCI